MSDHQPPSSPEGVLVSLKLKLTSALGVPPPKLKLLVDKYVRENMNVLGSKAHYTRMNTFNDINSDRMTIKVFFKFLRILDVRSITFSVKVTIGSGRTAEVGETITLTREQVQLDDAETPNPKKGD